MICLMGSHLFVILWSLVASRCQGKIAEAAWSALGFKAGVEEVS